MSKDIDNKVVSMEFDNSKFDKPAKESMGTLDNLKKSLDFKGVETGFDKLNQAIKAVTFAPIENGINSVYARFTAFERFTIQLYDRLANKIIDIGTKIATETFITPRKSGFSEYEQKMDAIQVMLNSTDYSIDYINKKLEELNKYADDTIYSFGDMTSNIGKFTNAGVDLNLAVDAIKGVSNVAALAGANAVQASRAMYNFSQALGLGAVRVQDWMSIENANMATVEFKEALIDMAAELGTIQKVSKGVGKTLEGTEITAQNFRTTLEQNWLTSDVLTKTLARFSDETDELGKKAYKAATEIKTLSMLMDTLKEALQSGWSETWSLIIGDFDEAKTTWTNVSNVLGGLIGKMAESRNTLLKFWKSMGGRASMLKAFSNIWSGLVSIMGAVRDAFRTVFPPITGKKLVDFTKRFEDLTRKLKPSAVTLSNLRKVFTGFFNAIGIGIDIVKSFAKAVSPIFGKAFSDGSKGILSAAASLGEWITKMRVTIKESRIFERVFSKVASVLEKVVSAASAVFKTVINIVKTFKNQGFKAGIESIKDGFLDLIKYIWDLIKKADPIGALKKLGNKIYNAIEKWPITEAFKKILTSIYEFLKYNPITAFIVGVFEGLIGTIQSIIDKFRNIDISSVKGFTESVAEQFQPLVKIKNVISKIFNGIITLFKKLAPVFKAAGTFLGNVIKKMFSGLFGIIERSDLGDIGGFLAGGGIGSFFYNLGGSLKTFSSIGASIKGVLTSVSDTLSTFQKALNAVALKQIAIAIAILAGSLLVLAAIPKTELQQASAVIVELFAGLVISMKSLARSADMGLSGSAGLIGISVAMLSVGASVLMLSSALAVLSLINYDNLVKGMMAVIAILAAIAKFVKSMSGSKGKIASIFPILAVAVLLQSIALALVELSIASKINPKGLLGGVEAIVVVLAAVMVAYYAISKSTRISSAISAVPLIAMVGVIAAIGASLFALTIAAKIDSDGLSKAVISLTALILVVAGSYAIISKTATIRSVFSAAPLIAMIGVIASIAASLFLLTVLTKKNPEALIPAVLSIAALVLTVSAAYVMISKQAGKLSVLKVMPIVSMMYSMLAIAGALSMLTFVTKFSPSTLVDATLALISIMAALVVLCGIISKFNLTSGIKTAPIVAISVAIVLLTVPLALLITSIKKQGELSNGEKAFKLLESFSVILLGVGVVFVAITKLSKKIKKTGLVKTISGIALLAILISGVSFAMRGLRKIETESLKKLALLLSILMAVTLVFSAAASLKAIERGLTVLSKVFIGLSAAMLIGASAVGILVATLKTLSSLSADEINRIGESLSGLADVIIQHGDKIAKAVGKVIGMVITTILQTIKESLTSILEGTLELVIAVVDNLLEHAPELIDKLLQLVGELLDGLSRNSKMLAEKLVKALYSIVKSVAEAVAKYGSEIIDAVSELLDAIASLVSMTFTKLLGGANKELSKFVESVVRVILPVIALVEVLSALKKALSLGDAFSKITKFIKNLPKKIGDVLYIFKEKNVWATLASTLSNPITAITAAAALAVSAFAIVGTKLMKVSTETDKYVSNALGKVIEKEQEYQKLLDERNEKFKSIDDETNATEELIKKLRECVDQNGKIKKGYESRFNYIKTQLSSALDIEVDAETGIVSIINEQNEALDIQSKKVDEIIKKKNLQAKLEASQAGVEEMREKLRSGEYKNAEAEAKKAYDDFMKEDKGGMTNAELVERALRYKELYKLGSRRSAKEDTEYYELYEERNALEDVLAAYYALDMTVSKAELNTQKATAYVQRYDKAYSALDGTLEDVQKAADLLNSELVLSDAGASARTVKNQFEALENQIRTASEAGVEYSEETKQYYANLLNTLGSDLKTFGDDGKQYLTEKGFKNGEAYVKSIVEGAQSAIKEANAKETFREWFATEDADVDGLLRELNKEGIKSIEEAYRKLGIVGLEAFREAHGIHSPSKAFARLAAYDIMGLVEGVEKTENSAEKTYAAIAASTMATYAAAASKASSQYQFSPMINTSGIQNGTNYIRGQLSSLQDGRLNTSMTTRLAASIDQTKLEAGNDKIVSAIEELRSDMDYMTQVMSNLKVVMDTGATVGALAPAMDTELGRRVSRKTRGVN